MNAPLPKPPTPATSADSWWRVTFDEHGELLGCDSIDPVEDADSWTVIYVLASDEEAAKAAAERIRQRNRQRVRRAKNLSSGLCADCGRPKSERFKRACEVCASRRLEAQRRAAARRRGEAVAPLPPKSVAFARRKADDAVQHRLETLEEVLEESRHRTICKLRVWLMAEIKACRLALEATP